MMRRILVIASWFTLLITVNSCKLEPCKNVVCVHGRALEDGNDCICLCDFGWSGAGCTIEDKCKTGSVVCLNGGQCDPQSGSCDCLPGYEGDSCQFLSRDKFLDNGAASHWDARDTCSGLYTYIVTIAEGANERTLTVANIRALGASETIFVSVDGFVFQQNFPTDIGSVRISQLEGTMYQSRDTIDVSYQVEDTNSGNTSNCKGIWIRM